MPTFSVPKDCKGFDFADGSRANARNGKITVDDAHADAYRKDGNWAYIGSSGYLPPTVSADKNNDCTKCGFAAWWWSSRCPKCGDVLPLKKK